MSNNPASSIREGDTTGKPRSKARGRVTVIRERCKGCGYCVEFCPTKVLAMSPEFNVKGYHYPMLSDGKDCTGCDLCGMFCPDYAVYGTRVASQEAGEQAGK